MKEQETTNFDMDSLINHIDSKEVIPVIGDDLILYSDSKEKKQAFSEYLYEEIAEGINITKTQEPNHGLPSYFRSDFSEQSCSFYEDTYIPSINNKKNNKLDTDFLKDVATIEEFDTYISTSIDNLLIQTLIDQRAIDKNNIQVIDHRFPGRPRMPYNCEMPVVTVFDLLGNINENYNYAFDQREILEHFYSLRCHEYEIDNLFKLLFKKINGKILLFIGCRFPDWFFRFIIRIIQNRDFSGKSVKSFIVNDNSSISEEQKRFFEHSNVQLIDYDPTNNIQSFLKELLKVRKKLSSVRKKMEGTGWVYLSYSNRNKKKAESLKIRLQEKGIKVYFRQHSKICDILKQDIIQQIKRSKIFVSYDPENIRDKNNNDPLSVEWHIAKGLENAKENFGKYKPDIKPCKIPVNEDKSDPEIEKFIGSIESLLIQKREDERQ